VRDPHHSIWGFIDRSDHLPDAHGCAFRDAAREDAADIRGDIDIRFLRLKLAKRIGGGDGFAVLLVPLEQNGLSDGFTQCWNDNVGRHKCGEV
jgi:hypothetical protein